MGPFFFVTLEKERKEKGGVESECCGRDLSNRTKVCSTAEEEKLVIVDRWARSRLCFRACVCVTDDGRVWRVRCQTQSIGTFVDLLAPGAVPDMI